MAKSIEVSALPKTWIKDIDGTICKHNGYKIDGHDTLLPGAKEFFATVGQEDKIIFVTSRTREYAKMTEKFLTENGIHWDAIVYDLPYGERILVNDKKPSGLETSVAINTVRDIFMEDHFIVNEDL